MRSKDCDSPLMSTYRNYQELKIMRKKTTRKYNQASHVQTNYNYLNVCTYFQNYQIVQLFIGRDRKAFLTTLKYNSMRSTEFYLANLI